MSMFSVGNHMGENRRDACASEDSARNISRRRPYSVRWLRSIVFPRISAESGWSLEACKIVIVGVVVFCRLLETVAVVV